MKLEIVRRTAMLAVLAITVFCFRSLEAIAVGYAVSAWLDVIIVALPMKKLIGYGIAEQLRDTWKILIATGIMSVFVYTLYMVPINYVLLLFLQIILGALVYILCCLVLRIEIFQYVLNVAVKLFMNRK